MDTRRLISLAVVAVVTAAAMYFVMRGCSTSAPTQTKRIDVHVRDTVYIDSSAYAGRAVIKRERVPSAIKVIDTSGYIVDVIDVDTSMQNELNYYIEQYVLAKSRIEKYETWTARLDTNLSRAISINDQEYRFIDSTNIRYNIFKEVFAVEQHASPIVIDSMITVSRSDPIFSWWDVAKISIVAVATYLISQFR